MTRIDMAVTPSSPPPYDEHFFAYTSSHSQRSAQIIVPILRKLLPNVTSVADFGCAHGVWLRCWMDNSVDDIQGIDGDYVDRSALLIPNECFHAQDLNDPIDLMRRFDLTYSFEVAEHLRPDNSQRLVDSLTHHADVILFSAAPKGQGGENHINEQSFEYWRALFAKRGFRVYDAVRPHLIGKAEVSVWYRYNIMLYVKDGAELSLPQDVLSARVPDEQPIADISPPLYKLRKAIIRVLPTAVQNALASAKARHSKQSLPPS